MSNSSISCIRLSDFYHEQDSLIQLDKYTLIYFSKGNGELTIDFKKYNFEKDRLFILSKNQLLDYHFNKNNDGFIIQCDQQIINNLNATSLILQENHIFNYWIHSPQSITSNDSYYSTILSLYKAVKSSKNELIDHEIIANIFKGLLLKIYRANSYKSLTKPAHYNTIFNNFKATIDANIYNTRNTLTYAEKLSISYKHLNNICKATYKNTAKDFVTENTKLEIRRQLALGLTTNALSNKLGFDEPTNFVKYCKHYLGETPGNIK